MSAQAIAADPRRALLACPACHGSLDWSGDSCRCVYCFHSYAIQDGIPVLLVATDKAAHDEIDHHNSGHKAAQADYFDHQQVAEFEIARPNNAPPLYRWLMREKFRRSMSELDGVPAPLSRVALTVCGGSGMDAQFLAERGFDVIASDLSLGAARRCRERARRFGLPILSVVADTERLPFADQTVPLTYVHDGLHHLEDPLTGLKEMARVTKSAISITEPARAAVTAVAIRLGMADAFEAPGNRVARLVPARVTSALRELGFEAVSSRRYAMYYRHHPGTAMKLLSRPGFMPLVQGSLTAVNVVAGRWGNKLVVSGRRSTHATRKEG